MNEETGDQSLRFEDPCDSVDELEFLFDTICEKEFGEAALPVQFYPRFENHTAFLCSDVCVRMAASLHQPPEVIVAQFVGGLPGSYLKRIEAREGRLLFHAVTCMTAPSTAKRPSSLYIQIGDNPQRQLHFARVLAHGFIQYVLARGQSINVELTVSTMGDSLSLDNDYKNQLAQAWRKIWLQKSSQVGSSIGVRYASGWYTFWLSPWELAQSRTHRALDTLRNHPETTLTLGAVTTSLLVDFSEFLPELSEVWSWIYLIELSTPSEFDAMVPALHNSNNLRWLLTTVVDRSTSSYKGMVCKQTLAKSNQAGSNLLGFCDTWFEWMLQRAIWQGRVREFVQFLRICGTEVQRHLNRPDPEFDSQTTDILPSLTRKLSSIIKKL